MTRDRHYFIKGVVIGTLITLMLAMLSTEGLLARVLLFAWCWSWIAASIMTRSDWSGFLRRLRGLLASIERRLKKI